MKKKSTLLSLCAMFAMAASAQAPALMSPASLDYPSGLYASFPPGSVSITYDNQPIELIDPVLNDFDEEVVIVYARLGDEEPVEVEAALLYSFGNPEDPEDPDVWNLDIALYNLDNLYSFDGNTIVINIPEGIVKNKEGAINPEQEFTFYIVPTWTEYSCTPETGSLLDKTTGFNVDVDFGNVASLAWLQDDVCARTYDPVYKETLLPLDEKVMIVGNQIQISLEGLPDGEYEVVVPEGFVLISDGDEDYLSPDIWLEYTVEGAQSTVRVIQAPEGRQPIFSINGTRVANPAAGGIYIVNGKKLIVR